MDHTVGESGVVRYSKPSAGYLKTKTAFYDDKENARWLDIEAGVRRSYLQQPPRTRCAVCAGGLGPAQFTLRGVGYGLCGTCGHFNGAHEDTRSFAEALYQAGHADASSVYSDPTSAEYRQRLEAIYVPKVHFLQDALRARGEDPSRLSYADLGSGGGHFVAAMRQEGLARSVGYETSAELVRHTNALHGTELLRRNEADDLARIAATADADVLTMIFALEHVPDVRGFLQAVRANPRVRYFFFAVPMFTPSVFLEGVFPDLMPRTLGIGHTHLFTERSVVHLCREFGLERVAEWWFGANAFDVHRLVKMRLGQGAGTAGGVAPWDDMILPMLEDLQAAFDRHKLSSEVHLVTAVHRETPP